MTFGRKPSHNLKRLIRALYSSRDFNAARKKLLLCDDLSDKERTMLNKVSLLVHRNDGTYTPTAAQHYLRVGLSAIGCIENVFEETHAERPIRSVLDFGCGYGRALRFLRVRFPDAEITASDIDPIAVAFCRRTFSVKGLLSDQDFATVPLIGTFDLIWCGSLITHISEKDTSKLLHLFNRHLAPGALCIFTANDQASMEWIRHKHLQAAPEEVFAQFYRTGYGYAAYRHSHQYGVSVVSRDRMSTIAHQVGQWKMVSYLARGWDNQQDVYGFANTRKGGAADGGHDAQAQL